MKINRQSLLLTFLGIVLLAGCSKAPQSSNDLKSTKQVGILLLASHPVIQDLRDGFRERLNEIAAEKGVNISYDEKNAEGNAATLNQLAAYFSSGSHALVYAVGSDSALKLKSKESRIPVLFAGTPDPVRSGFVDSLENPGSNLTGVKFIAPADVLLDVFKYRFPDGKRIAVLRNPAEINSQSVAEPLIAEARKRGFEVGDFGVTEISQLSPVLQRIATEKWDAVFIPNDNLIYQNLKQVSSVLSGVGVPFFSVTDVSVKMGAAFAVGAPYREMGRRTADVAAELLFGNKAPGTVPVLVMKDGSLFVPADQAEAFSGAGTKAFPVKPVK